MQLFLGLFRNEIDFSDGNIHVAYQLNISDRKYQKFDLNRKWLYIWIWSDAMPSYDSNILEVLSFKIHETKWIHIRRHNNLKALLQECDRTICWRKYTNYISSFSLWLLNYSLDLKINGSLTTIINTSNHSIHVQFYFLPPHSRLIRDLYIQEY